MRASVVIRVKDEAAALQRLLGLLARQTAAHQIVVVDHASSDGSAAVAHAAGARVVRITDFTYGRALNLGAAACTAHEWWTDQWWHRSHTRARLDPRRLARPAGKWAGSR